MLSKQANTIRIERMGSNCKHPFATCVERNSSTAGELHHALPFSSVIKDADRESDTGRYILACQCVCERQDLFYSHMLV